MFYLLLVAVILLCNISIFGDGYSYIGFSAVITLLIGIILFIKNYSKLEFSILSSVFILSILNLFIEVVYKIGILPFFNPTRVDGVFYMGAIYLIISIISGVLWSKRKVQ